MLIAVFLIYALILLALAGYLASQTKQFLGQPVTPATRKELVRFAWAFAACAVLAVAACWPINALRLAAIIAGALVAGGLGLRLPKYMA